MKKEELKIGYNTAYLLTDLIGKLVLPAPTLNEFDKIRGLRDKLESIKEEYVLKLRELLGKLGVNGDIDPKDAKYNETMIEVNKLFNSGSSLEVQDLQQYTREEVGAMINGSREQFSVDDFGILMLVLAKSE